MRRKSKLKARRSKFIDEYILTFDGQGSAIKAGYSEHTARCMASKLLANPEVKEELDYRLAEYKKKNEVRREKNLDILNQLVAECINDKDRNHLLKAIDIMNKMGGEYSHTIVNKTKEQPLFPD
jgi:phage terminase small subunit